jgi:hypothetical protein
MKKFLHLNRVAVLVVATVLLAGLFLVSCSKENSNSPASKSSSSSSLKDMCAESEFILWAGQNINAGNLIVWNDETNLYVTYSIGDPNQALDEVHLWVGADLTLLPKNKKGNPEPGLFPYKAENLGGVLEYLFTIPLTNIPVDLTTDCFSPLYIAAHGKAISSETMWSEGQPIDPDNGNWATYSTYTICCNSAQK